MNSSSNFVDPTPHLWWIASRASGIVAILLLTYTVLVGLMMGGKLVTRLLARPGRGSLAVKQLLQTHEYASLAALVAIGIHGVTLLGDAFLNPSISEIAVPFASDYRPFYTGLGIVAGYVTALLALSFYLRSKIGMALWKKLHRWTIAAYALSVVHVLGAGTDAGSQWFEIPLLASAGVVALVFAVRISSLARSRSAGRKRARPSPAVRAAQVSGPVR